jgi:hypothetical protein
MSIRISRRKEEEKKMREKKMGNIFLFLIFYSYLETGWQAAATQPRDAEA